MLPTYQQTLGNNIHKQVNENICSHISLFALQLQKYPQFKHNWGEILFTVILFTYQKIINAHHSETGLGLVHL